MKNLEKKYAALAYALGLARAALGDVVDGDFSPEHIRRVFDGTAANRIARSIGLEDNGMDVYWDDCLSDAEKHKLQGYN